MKDIPGPYLTYLLQQLHAADVASEPPRGWKKIDAQDSVLGDLSVEMKKLWILREQLWVETEEIADKMTDLVLVFETDLELKGEDSEGTLRKELREKLDPLRKELVKPIIMFRAAHALFESMVKLDFKVPDGKSIVGVRENFQIICRDDGSRGDERMPYDRIVEAFQRIGLMPKLGMVIEEMIVVTSRPERSDEATAPAPAEETPKT